MKQYFALLLPMLIYFNANSQIIWLKTGQKWEMAGVHGWFSGSSTVGYSVGGDTIYAGINCKKIGDALAYTYNRKVFVAGDNENFYKVYDFNLLPSEELSFFDGQNTYSYTVDSIGIANFGDFDSVSYQKAHWAKPVSIGNYNLDFYIIEGVGMVENIHSLSMDCMCGHFFPNKYICDFNTSDGASLFLLTFREGDRKLHASDTTSSCGTINTKDATLSKIGLEVSPNPVNEILLINLLWQNTFENSPLEQPFLEISDVSGHVLHREKMLSSKTEISTQHFPNGLYLVVLKNGNRVVRSERVVVQH